VFALNACRGNHAQRVHALSYRVRVVYMKILLWLVQSAEAAAVRRPKSLTAGLIIDL
jgi:hypothetical protein